MKDTRFQEIKALVECFDSLPDAAFLSALAENGVDADDLVAYSKHADKISRAVRSAKMARRK
jgi:hypothetical protein